ncbi:hypothetical protein BT69DRAFT_1330895 [Atractiella rhizophila]|nr:hypothetical protein BT69DRAFT_1330895 [Atractiella rhizophila]
MPLPNLEPDPLLMLDGPFFLPLPLLLLYLQLNPALRRQRRSSPPLIPLLSENLPELLQRPLPLPEPNKLFSDSLLPSPVLPKLYLGNPDPYRLLSKPGPPGPNLDPNLPYPYLQLGGRPALLSLSSCRRGSVE